MDASIGTFIYFQILGKQGKSIVVMPEYVLKLGSSNWLMFVVSDHCILSVLALLLCLPRPAPTPIGNRLPGCECATITCVYQCRGHNVAALPGR